MAETKLQSQAVNTTIGTILTGGSKIASGWGFQLGDGTNVYKQGLAVSFGVTFATKPMVIIGSLGYKDSSDPTDVGDFGAWPNINSTVYSISTTGFTVGQMTVDNTVIANTRRIGFAWIAIGT